MHLKGYTTILFLLANIAMFTGCTLEDPEPSPFNFPVNLQANQEYSLITLNWSAVKVTDFREYIILQSSDEIPALPEPVASSQVSVIKRIDDADINTFSASDVLFTPRVCYKVYVAVGDRFLQSPNVCVDQDFQVIGGFYDRAAHLPGMDEMALFDRLDLRLAAYNYKEGNITKTVNEFSFSFPIMEISTWEGNTNLFAYEQSPARLFRYSFPELGQRMEKFFNGFLFAVKPHEQFLFAAVEEFNKSLIVLNRNNLTEMDHIDGLTGNRNLAVFDGDPTIVLDINDGAIFRYSVSASGKLSFLDSKSPGILQPTAQNMSSNSSQYFIGGRRGEILDRDGNKVGSLVNGLTSFVTMSRFSADETKVVYLLSDNISTRVEVVDITNLQDLQMLASYDLPAATFSDIIVDTDVITVIGVAFDSGQSQTFALKYPMP